MKKLLIAIATLAMGITANAQGFAGDTLGLDVAHTSVDDASSTVTTFQIAPEFGYHFNNTWAIGMQFAYGLTASDAPSVNQFTVLPYIRATFASASIVDFFAELGAGYTHASCNGSSVGGFTSVLRPGMAINFTDKFAVIARTNILEYSHIEDTNFVDFALNKGFSIGVNFKF